MKKLFVSVHNENINKKKLFVSVPMRGRSDDDIAASILKMKQLAEIIFGEELEPVSTFCTPQEREERIPEDVVNNRIWEISLAVELMSKCDYFAGVFDSWGHEGCAIENGIAAKVDMKSVLFECEHIAPDCIPMNKPVDCVAE